MGRFRRLALFGEEGDFDGEVLDEDGIGFAAVTLSGKGLAGLVPDGIVLEVVTLNECIQLTEQASRFETEAKLRGCRFFGGELMEKVESGGNA